jgi:hypothetical protein
MQTYRNQPFEQTRRRMWGSVVNTAALEALRSTGRMPRSAVLDPKRRSPGKMTQCASSASCQTAGSKPSACPGDSLTHETS